jgi:DNA-binding response OmpR family regulator
MVNPFPESKILIIDDDLNLQSSLKRLLIKENFIVAVASEGMEALSLMEKFKPNCILLDLGMP